MRTLVMGWDEMVWTVRRILSVALVLVAALTFGPALATTDADGDGYDEGTDCDDLDESVWSLPGELSNLHFVSRTTFVWDSAVDLPSSSVTYVTLRSTSPSVFATAPPAACSDTEGLTTSTTDSSVPAPGSALFYLVRARNGCGEGSLGHQSNGTPRSGLSCDCSALCNDGQSCTRDRCSDGACVHDPITTSIQDQPEGVAVCPGGSATFRVRGVSDGSTLHYQWKKNGVNVGADSPTLTLTGLSAADNNAQITVVVTGSCAGTTSQAAALTVFSSAASCAGGGNGYEAPNGASKVSALSPSPCQSKEVCGNSFLHSGEFHLEDVDMEIAGRGFDFVWRRSYRQRTGMLTTMGQNWDFSYNRGIVLSSGTVYLYGGDGRADAYAPSPTGCYTSQGFFRELCPQADGTWLLTFPGHTTWRFASLDGSPAQGRILSVQDSDANTMSFLYDSAGRLSTITDTLGRPITISYDPDGYISAVSDFGGRTVTYQRFPVADPDGMPGDLKSVTSPPVTGTPGGNDFTRTTSYTYTKNTGQPALDHNLLTVRQSLSVHNNDAPVVFVHNVYTPTTNPASPAFDRLQKQVYADDPFTSVSYVYVVPPPGEEPGAVTKTIVRDRSGNVGEVYFDSSNRAVAVRQYTGRAPSLSLPTDATTNRPGTPLRPTDPTYYRTVFTWNTESLITQISFPKLDSAQFTYDSSSTDVKVHANLLQYKRLPGPAGGDQMLQQEQWTYAPGFGT
jgi:YD repeat-containing protein